MNWKQERKQERRLRKGLRAGPMGVIPPSVGKRHVPLTHRFPDLYEFIHGDERFRVLSRGGLHERRHGQTLDDLANIHKQFGIGGLVKWGFPERYFIEMDDDDTLEVWFALSFN